jgi:MFS family permease
MAPVAIAFAVLAHGSASDVGYVLAAGTVPLVILLLVGGVVGDRISRRKLMLQSDALRTIAECALGVCPFGKLGWSWSTVNSPYSTFISQ